MKGRIIKIISNQYTVLDHNYNSYETFCLGKIRNMNIKPKVGDLVDFNQVEDKYAIENVYPRENELVRPPLANIDQAIIVMSALEPAFSNVLVDRLIFLASYANIKPILYITKMDLVKADNIIFKYIEDYRSSGYTVLCGNKTTLDTNLLTVIENKVSVLMGQSGVGKSSMLNLINPDYNLRTNIISKALNRGKHTTRHSELFLIDKALLADTPGFSALEFINIDPLILKDVIHDFKPFHNQCKFNDCIHINEPGCAIKKAVEENKLSKLRYESYKDVLTIIKNGGPLI